MATVIQRTRRYRRTRDTDSLSPDHGLGRVRNTRRSALDIHLGARHPRNSADHDHPATPFTSLLLPSGELCLGYSLFTVWQHQSAMGSLPRPHESRSVANTDESASISRAKTEALNSCPSYCERTSPRLVRVPALPASPVGTLRRGPFLWILTFLEWVDMNLEGGNSYVPSSRNDARGGKTVESHYP